MVPEANDLTTRGETIGHERRSSRGESNCDSSTEEGPSNLDRRSVLKVLGAGALPLVGGTASAAEGDGGYGVDGYGNGTYGDGTTTDSTTDGETTDDSTENTILFDGVGTSGVTRYEVTVTGTIEKSSDGGASISDDDTIDGGHATGSVTSWRDAYRFSGELEGLTVDGQARVFVNGERIDPANYGSDQSHVVTVVGNGTYSEYGIGTDGSIEILEGDDASVVSEGRAEGSIERDVHRYRLTGSLIDFTFYEGGTHVYLDDQRIDPEDYTGGEDRLPHAIVLDGTDTSGESTYSFSIDGNVAPSEYRGATIDEATVIDDSIIHGAVDAGTVDAYWFDGSISNFKLVGEADVDVEYHVRS